MTLTDLLREGSLDALDLNCSEKILYGANQVYHLGLDEKALRLSAGFGGGLGCEELCGAIAGCVMTLSALFVRQHAHESTRIKELCSELVRRYREKMGAADCRELKARYRKSDTGCRDVILAAAEILDEIIPRELENC